MMNVRIFMTLRCLKRKTPPLDPKAKISSASWGRQAWAARLPLRRVPSLLVIRNSAKQGQGPIELLDHDDPGQFVG